MTSLSIALVLIFVMWLIDKHNLWRRVGKIMLVIVVLGVLGIAGMYGWEKYEERKAAREQAAAEAAEKVQHDAQVKACLARYAHPDVLNQEACERDPDSQPVDFIPDPAPHQPRKPSALHHVRNTDQYAVNITTTEYGTLVCGHVGPGQTAVLLGEDGTYVKIRTSSGQVGWASSSDFEKVD